LTHFHGFSVRDPARRGVIEPALWIAPDDAAPRGLADGAAIRSQNERADMRARGRVTPRIPAGTVWVRAGGDGRHRLTSGAAVVPDAGVDLFGFSGGQAAFDARVEVSPLA